MVEWWVGGETVGGWISLSVPLPLSSLSSCVYLSIFVLLSQSSWICFCLSLLVSLSLSMCHVYLHVCLPLFFCLSVCLPLPLFPFSIPPLSPNFTVAWRPIMYRLWHKVTPGHCVPSETEFATWMISFSNAQWLWAWFFSTRNRQDVGWLL